MAMAYLVPHPGHTDLSDSELARYLHEPERRDSALETLVYRYQAMVRAVAHQGIGFAVMLPLSFLAGTFVPISGMKLVPRAIAEWDPLSALVAAVRQVCQGTQSSGSLQLDHPVPAMIAWCLLIIAVCVPLALHRFRTASA
jgi:ABC-type multidrug transport system permease subunit